MFNHFATRNENVFIEYEDIIKSSNVGLLKMIKNTYRDDIKDFIHIDQIDNLTEDKLDIFSTARLEKNILHALRKVPFDHDYVFKTLTDSKVDLYASIQPLMFADVVNVLLSQKFVKNVYIYTKEHDFRIECDISILFNGSSKVSYVSGDFNEALDMLDDITLYVLSDIDKMGQIIAKNKQEYCEFMIAEYGYNYKEEDGIVRLKGNYEELQQEKIFKMGTFSPIKF